MLGRAFQGPAGHRAPVGVVREPPVAAQPRHTGSATVFASRLAMAEGRGGAAGAAAGAFDWKWSFQGHAGAPTIAC